jgi:hypothetical protein
MRLLAEARDGRVVLALQNAPYDMAVLLRHRPEAWPLVVDAYEAGGIHDTMTAEWLIDTAHGMLRMEWDEETEEWKSNKSYSLEAMANARLGWPFYKDEWRLRYAELMDVSLSEWPEAASSYPQKDASATLQIAAMQRRDAAEIAPHDPLVADLAAQCRAYMALHLASCWGIELDPLAVDDLDRRLRAECERLAALGLVDAGLLMRHLRGKKAGELSRKIDPLRQLVLEDFARRGVEVPLTDGGKTSENKQVKCSADVLSDCDQGTDAEPSILSIMSDYLQVKQKIGTTERMKIVGRGPVHPRYAWAETGRTTCSGGKKRKGAILALNIQQFPRKMPGTLEGQPGVRECLVARKGQVLSSSDYAGLELATWAQVLQYMVGANALADAINAGDDVHSRMGAQLLGITYEDFLALLAAKDPRAKEARQVSKVLDFGLPGGMGAIKFTQYAKAQGLRINEEQARKLKRDWMKAWPQAKTYFDMISEIAGNGGATIVQFGSNRIRGNVGFTDAANGYFQGLAADGAKDALWRTVVECYDARKRSVLLGSRVVGFIHDEILGEHPEEIAHEGATRIGEIMVETMDEWTPDVRNKVEPALMRRLSKAAGDPVKDKNGRLIPFEDRLKKEAA